MNYPSDDSTYFILRRKIRLIINETGIQDHMKLSMIKELVK